LRIVHVSDIHFWTLAVRPWHLLNKRLVGIASLLAGRARRFQLERIHEVVARVRSLDPDHILITGDLTTTAFPSEFLAARSSLASWLKDPARVTVLPGNHDRYTVGSHRAAVFESHFGMYAPSTTYPWLRFLDDRTAILGRDPTRSSLSARGKLPASQLEAARELVPDDRGRPERLIVACHYPLEAPADYRKQLAPKRMVNARDVGDWLGRIGPHVYCCGHVHAAWAFEPGSIPGQLCLNSGAPLLRDHSGDRPPGFLEILLEGSDVVVRHHAWGAAGWVVRPLRTATSFFAGS
jgi:hypothetical protein